MEKILIRLLIALLAAVFAALDTAVFYIIASYFLTAAITWPVLAAVFWVGQGVISLGVKKELKDQGVL